MTPDPRITPARPDLAAASLEGAVEAARFVEPRDLAVTVPVAPVTAEPDGGGRMTSQLLFGERFLVYERDGLWAWGQSALDGYVGYVPSACLDDPAGLGMAGLTHQVATLGTHLYPEPEVKARPGLALPYGARVAVTGRAEAFVSVAPGGFVPAAHLAPIGGAADWVAEAERLLGVPYLWGGRSSCGIDCSGLVQIALQAAGRDCPRDSDQQEACLGRPLAKGERPARGDLVFWAGHVGIMLTATRFLHANAHHMAVAAEPLAAARRRIAQSGGGAVTSIRRP